MNRYGILAFCGSKGSGKSTSASIFKEQASFQTEEIALAGHLKEVCAPIFGVDFNLFIDPKLKEVELDNPVLLTRENLTELLQAFYVENIDFDKHIRQHVARVITTPRKLLQYIGTEVLHPIDPLIHTKIALRKKDPNKLTIITDLRFVNEFEYMLSASIPFLPVYVKNQAAETAASIDAHPSERQVELFKARCRQLDNEGSLTELRAKLNELVSEVGRES